MNDHEQHSKDNEPDITRYLLGDLPPEEAKAVEHLLEESEESQALAQDLELTLGLLRDALADSTEEEDIALAPERREAVLAAEEEPEVLVTQKKGNRLLTWTKQYPRLVANIAALFVAGFISVGIMQMAGKNGSAPLSSTRMVNESEIAATEELFEDSMILKSDSDGFMGKAAGSLALGLESAVEESVSERVMPTDHDEDGLVFAPPVAAPATAAPMPMDEEVFSATVQPSFGLDGEAVGGGGGGGALGDKKREAEKDGRLAANPPSVVMPVSPRSPPPVARPAASSPRPELIPEPQVAAERLSALKELADVETVRPLKPKPPAGAANEILDGKTPMQEKGATLSNKSKPGRSAPADVAKSRRFIEGNTDQSGFAEGAPSEIAVKDISSPGVVNQPGVNVSGAILADDRESKSGSETRGRGEDGQSRWADRSELVERSSVSGKNKSKDFAYDDVGGNAATTLERLEEEKELSVASAPEPGAIALGGQAMPSLRGGNREEGGKSAEARVDGSTFFGYYDATKQNVAEIEATAAAYRADMIVKEKRLKAFEGREGEALTEAAAMSALPEETLALRKSKLDSELSLTLMRQELGEKHPDVLKTQKHLQDLEGKLDGAIAGVETGLQADYDVAAAKYSAITGELDQLKQVESKKSGTGEVPSGGAYSSGGGEIMRELADRVREGEELLALGDDDKATAQSESVLAEDKDNATARYDVDLAFFKSVEDGDGYVNEEQLSELFANSGVPDDNPLWFRLDIPKGQLVVEGTEDRLASFDGIWPKLNLNGQMDKDPEQASVYRAHSFNPYVDTVSQAFSTFAIDVDDASYTLTRSHMKQGVLPPAEAIRTEEFVNAFNYRYPAPDRGVFSVHSQAAPSPFGSGMLLNVGVKGKVIGRDSQRPAMLTFVIDTSGSMDTPDRLGLALKSLKLLIEQLGERDQVAIVQYDVQARMALDYTAASDKATILQALDDLQISGSTNLEEGLKQGYAAAAKAFDPDGVNRVLLISDGMANLGDADADLILASVEQYRKQGITCSIFGFGLGNYNDAMLETLANKGDGVYRYIDSLDEARRVFVDDLAATLHYIARDVKIQVEFNSARVTRYRQLGYENRQLKTEQFRDNTVDAGEVGSGQSVTALYEMDLVGRPDDVIATVRVRYRDVDSGKFEEMEQQVTVSDLVKDYVTTDSRFKLAACVAEFSEILRGSPFADGSDFAMVADELRPVAQELNLDENIQELLRMVESAEGLPRSSQ